jgi:hypothetical protein
VLILLGVGIAGVHYGHDIGADVRVGGGAGIVRVYALDDFTVKVSDTRGVRRVVVVAGGYIVGYSLADVRAGGVRAVVRRKVSIDFYPYVVVRCCGYVVRPNVSINFVQQERVACGVRVMGGYVIGYLLLYSRMSRSVRVMRCNVSIDFV